MAQRSLLENTGDRLSQDSQNLPATTEKPLSSVRVLMVEDDSHYYTFVRRLLLKCEQPRFEFVGAGSIAEASHYLSWTKPDIILLDLTLPDSNGLKTIETVRDMSQDIPIIILTGWSDEKIGLESVALGAQDYLVKHEIANDSLIRSIRYAIERRKFEEATLRWAAVRDFTSMLAHDLKVPLIGAGKVFDSLLLGQFGQLPAEQSVVLAELQKSNINQLRLVEDLLEVYRIESGTATLHFEPINIKPLISRCMANIREKFVEAHSILASVPNDLPKVLGDENALSKVIMNLLDNAIKFSNPPGQVKIHTELVKNILAISVHNEGPTIPTNVQVRLFQQFWRGIPGESYVARTGLGLYFCHRVISLHGGGISCQSTKEDGTTIKLTLPVLIPDSTSKTPFG